jgi:hypothetical protein
LTRNKITEKVRGVVGENQNEVNAGGAGTPHLSGEGINRYNGKRVLCSSFLNVKQQDGGN